MEVRNAERGSASLVYVIATLGVIAALVVPIVLWARTQGESVQGAGEVARDAEEARALLDLRNAIVVAEVHFAETGSYAGLTPEVASALDPATTYNSSPAAVPREVSIRAATTTSVVFATRTDGDRPLCAVVDATDGVRHGDTDPVSASTCTPAD